MGIIERVPTGIPKLDELIEGGFPRGNAILVSGSAGTGKTTFGVQFLYNGAVKFGEPGILVLLNERAETLKLYMSRFGWDLSELERRNQLAIIETAPIPISQKKGEEKSTAMITDEKVGIKTDVGIFEDILPFSTEVLAEMIDDKIRKLTAKRLVFDSITDLMMKHPDLFGVRLDLLWLIRFLGSRNLTSILASEVSREGEFDRFGVESFLVGGIVLLRSVSVREETINLLEIPKMRGTEHSKKKIAYRITSEGFQFIPSVRFGAP